MFVCRVKRCVLPALPVFYVGSLQPGGDSPRDQLIVDRNLRDQLSSIFNLWNSQNGVAVRRSLCPMRVFRPKFDVSVEPRGRKCSQSRLDSSLILCLQRRLVSLGALHGLVMTVGMKPCLFAPAERNDGVHYQSTAFGWFVIRDHL
jgi:hypothetical protein